MRQRFRCSGLSSAYAATAARWQETWRRNLAIVWLASAFGSAAMTFANPFLPLFLSRELGVTDPSPLAFWTGAIAASNGVTLMFASPIWGSIADRHGRKPMLMRALAGSGLFIGLMAFTQAPWQLVLTRLGFGAVTGVLPTGSAMIAAQTPRAHVAWALGVIASAFAVGGAIGPLIAGFLVPVIGLRGVFVFGGTVLVGAAVLVGVVMREVRQDTRQRPQVLRELRAAEGRSIVAILVLLTAQCLLWMSLWSALPMVALRVLDLAPSDAAWITGIAFATLGIASAGASISCARFTRHLGFRRVAFIAIVIASAAVLMGAATSLVIVLVATMAMLGLASGTLQVIVGGLLALEAPQRLVGTVFGFNNSALAIGSATGPFLIGSLAAIYGTAFGLGLCVVPLLAAALALHFVREPALALELPKSAWAQRKTFGAIPER